MKQTRLSKLNSSASARKLGIASRKVCFIGGHVSGRAGTANYKILLLVMRGMHLWRLGQADFADEKRKRKGAAQAEPRLDFRGNSRASSTSRTEKNEEALGKTSPRLRRGRVRLAPTFISSLFFSRFVHFSVHMDGISIAFPLPLASFEIRNGNVEVPFFQELRDLFRTFDDIFCSMATVENETCRI